MDTRAACLAPVLTLLVATGCIQRKTPEAAALSRAEAQATEAVRQDAAAVSRELELRAATVPAAAQQPAANPLAAQAAAQKLIRTGQINLEVTDYGEAVTRAEAVVESLGGYVADTQASRGAKDRRSGTLTVRIPAQQFKAALEGFRKLGKTLSESTSTQDVTKQYTDVETRLRVKRETAQRLRDILRAKAAELSEILEVEREIARVTEEIERLEGERRFYDQQVALSTITLNLSEPKAVVTAGAFKPVVNAVRGALRLLSLSVAAIIALVVFVAPWALVAWAVWRVIVWRRARRRGPAKTSA